MAYVAPTLTASGTAFAAFQSGGPTAILENLITANAGEPISMFRSAKTGNLRDVYGYLSKLCKAWNEGEPIATTDLVVDLKKAHVTFLALATVCNEIGVLCDANPGTLAPTVKNALIGARVKRTWP